MNHVSTLSIDPPLIPATDLLQNGSGPRRGAILIVEDRDDVREGLSQLLELHGFIVYDAADGEHALAHLNADPDTFALVLLDLLLPGAISGHGIRAAQLADPRLSNIPTIIVSACEPNSSGQAQLRPTAWLEKPFRFDALLGMVRRFVASEGGIGAG